MTLKQTGKIIQLAVILCIAFAFKYHYSTASVNDLKWVLAPTTFLVEFITGRHFAFESQAGYMIDDHTFLIAASCSGVNFLIISFLMLTLAKIWRDWQKTGWSCLPVAALAAYLSTLIANTTRIVTALGTQGLETRWFDSNALHRIEGIVVYFGFLIVLFLASERLTTCANTPNPFRPRYLLIIYYSVTLGVPLVRGSYRDPDFLQHAVFVFLIPLILVIPFVIFPMLRERLGSPQA